MASRKLWWGGAAVVVLVMFGACNAPDEASPDLDTSATSDSPQKSESGSETELTPTERRAREKELRAQPVWVATITDYADSYTPKLILDYGGLTGLEFELAHVAHLRTCGVDQAALDSRLREIAPVGTVVTFVRGVEEGSTPRFSRDSGFVHLAAPGADATTTPFGVSLNEQVIAEGDAALDPAIDFSIAALSSVAEQSKYGFGSPKAEPNATYWQKMLDASRTAWDGRIGYQAECRAADDLKIVAAANRDEEDRRSAGPDGIQYTSDDLTRHDGPDGVAFTDDDFYLEKPVYSSGTGGGGGGGSGGGRLCRRTRFC